MGAFIGDSLGLGPHWYYYLDEFRRDKGQWISGYTEPGRAEGRAIFHGRLYPGEEFWREPARF